MSDPKDLFGKADEMTATELGTRVHRALSDQHFGQHGTVGDLAREINEQMKVYSAYMMDDARLSIGDAEGNFVPVMVIHGGDLLHGNGPRPPDLMMEVNGQLYITDFKLQDADYSKIEERVMAQTMSDKMLAQAVKQITGREVPEPTIKPTRAPKTRDWEQRSKKRRR